MPKACLRGRVATEPVHRQRSRSRSLQAHQSDAKVLPELRGRRWASAPGRSPQPEAAPLAPPGTYGPGGRRKAPAGGEPCLPALHPWPGRCTADRNRRRPAARPRPRRHWAAPRPAREHSACSFSRHRPMLEARPSGSWTRRCSCVTLCCQLGFQRQNARGATQINAYRRGRTERDFANGENRRSGHRARESEKVAGGEAA